MSDTGARLGASLAGRYAIERELGRGGMATVFAARDLKHDRPVALKVLRPELHLGAERFLQEIRVTAQLQHPHIVPLFDSGEADGLLFYVMPLVEGESLRDRLQREHQLPLADVIAIARSVAGALAYAHERGIVHRDIKPENILLFRGQPLVSDFGIARAVSAAGAERLTGTGLALGTPAYMSPEQAFGGTEVDARSDIYSLGCVIYELVSGQAPFAGLDIETTLARRLSERVPPLSEVPVAFDAAVHQALATQPADRFATATAFAEALVAASSSASAQASVAVLPFEAMSGDPDSQYLADGIAEDIINALCKVPELRVASRTSSFAFRHKAEDVRVIAARLGVRTVLEGSVRRSGNRLRATAQLVNAADGYHLWSERFDRDIQDIFAIQDEIATAIARTLELKLAPHRPNVVRRPTDSIEAYDQYVKGRYHLNRRGAGVERALHCFQQAVKADARYAVAHAAIADCYNLLGWYRHLPPGESFPRAIAAARQALAEDPESAEALTSLGFAQTYYERAWSEAERSFLLATEINPAYPTLHHWYAEYLMVVGRIDEALRQARRAQELDPLGLIINTLLGMACYFARDYPQAQAELDRTMEMDPAFPAAITWRGLVELAHGQSEAAVATFARDPGLEGFRIAALAASGLEREAEEAMRALSGTATNRYVSRFELAVASLGLQRWEQGLTLLDQSVAEREPWAVFLRQLPLLDPVRERTEFTRLVASLRLPDLSR